MKLTVLASILPSIIVPALYPVMLWVFIDGETFILQAINVFLMVEYVELAEY